MSKYIAVYQDKRESRWFDLDKVVDDDGVLSIFLSGENGRRVCVRFAAYLAYRKTAEGDALQTLEAMSKSSGTTKSFYRVEDSEFLRWFREQSSGKYDRWNLVHFIVATMDDIIDIISLEDPSFEAE